MVSTPPPAAIGTTRVTGRVSLAGVCAEAPAVAATASPSPKIDSLWAIRIDPSRRDHICWQERSLQFHTGQTAGVAAPSNLV
jgi:hypothetical protein